MTIYYWKSGRKHSFTARDLTDAMDRKYALRRRYGGDFSGCSNFYYLKDDGTKEFI